MKIIKKKLRLIASKIKVFVYISESDVTYDQVWWLVVVVLKEERALYIHSPPPTIPAGPETRTHNLSITSPTL